MAIQKDKKFHATQISTAAAQGRTPDVTRQLDSCKSNPQLHHALADIALQYAAANGHAKLAKTLLKRGARNNKHQELNSECLRSWSEERASAIQLAARAGHTETVKVLVRAQRRLPFWPWRCLKEDGDWATAALHEAAGNGHFDTVKRMLDEGVSMVFAGFHATTPTLKGHGGISERNGTPVLYLAAQNGHVEVVKLLLRRGVKEASPLSERAIHFAAAGGHVDVVLELVQAGWDVNRDAFWGMNPAYIAALCGHRMVFQLLVERGGEVTEVALSRLDKLVEAKNGAAVGMLLSRAPGETFEELQGDFARLVKHAARHGDAECLRHVLEYAAQQDTTRQLDYRDLFFSGILNSEESVVRVLIDYCPWTAGEAKGIHYYIYQKAKSAHFDAVTALAEWHRKSAEDDCSILTSALVGAAVGGHVSIAERLIEEGAEVNAMGFVPKDDFGDRTVAECFPLHAAAYHAFDADVCKILLARGADPNAEDPSGMTALLYAAKRAERGASISIIKALVKSGGDVRATTVSRDTPLHLAVQCAPWTNTPSVKETMELRICKAALILLESGADINVKNSDGRTPLHLAKFERIFTWLQKRGADQTISDKDGLLPREYFEAQMEQRSRLLRDWEFNHGRSKVWKDSEWDWSHIRPKRGKTGPSQMRNEEREMKK